MRQAVKSSDVGKVKKYRKHGLLVVSLCVVGCNVPLIIAFMSFGGLSALASFGTFPPLVQIIGLVFGVVGMVSIVGYFSYRAWIKAYA